MIKYAIIYHNEIVNRDIVVFKSSNYELVQKVYNSRFRDNEFTPFEIVTKIEN